MTIKRRKIHKKGILKPSAKKLNLLPILLGILFICILLFLSKTFFVKKQENKTMVLSANTESNHKKGSAGDKVFKGALNRAKDLKISWYYNWSTLPLWGDPVGWNSEYWNNPEFVPLWSSKSYTNSLHINTCATPANQQRLINEINKRMDIICAHGYCNNGRYHLIGNEPDQGGSDSDGIDSSTDLPGDAAACYGTIIKAIKAKDPTAKFIMLALSKENRWDNYKFLDSFFAKWKQIWAGTDIYNLPAVVKGWSLHTYYESVDNCPTDDSRVRNYLNNIDGLLNFYFGRTVENQELWVTEMGTLWGLPGANTSERAKILNLMKCLMNVYENSPLVNRYAWFYLGTDSKWQRLALYDQAPSNYCVQPAVGGICLTDLGQRYISLSDSTSNSPTPTPTPPRGATPIPTTSSGGRLTPTPTGRLASTSSGGRLSPTPTGRLTSTSSGLSGGRLSPTPTRRTTPTPTPPASRTSTPTATRTPTRAPTPTLPNPTPTTGTANTTSHIPQILSPENFPDGSVNRDYNYTFEGTDSNVNEDLNIRIYGAPPGLRQDNCSQGINDQKKYIRCQLVGKPTSTGKFYGYIKLFDLDNTVTKNIRVIIN